MKPGDLVTLNSRPAEITRTLPGIGVVLLYRVRFEDGTTAYAKPSLLKPRSTLL